MMAYVGDTRSKKLLARLRDAGVGQMIVRGRLSGRRLETWAYDNGAYEDFTQSREFDAECFLADMRAIAAMAPEARPDFFVIPDVVADAERSIMQSLEWMKRLRGEGLYDITRPYFAVQDRMTVIDVPWQLIGGIFLGGSLAFKAETGADWAAAARAHGVPFHYARCGTRKKLMHAQALGAQSIDSSLPLWGLRNLRVFLDTLAQETLFAGLGEHGDLEEQEDEEAAP